MLSAANLRFQDYQFQVSTPQGVWRWTTRMDLTGPTPSYSVRDIITPYGLLRDSIPLPGIIVQAMAESIGQLQSSFVPAITVGPSLLTFVVDEGRGVAAPQFLEITNSGVFGSLLDVAITSNAPFVTTSPTSLGNLASTETGRVDVYVDSTDLVAASSPYNQTLVLQDETASNSPVTVPVRIYVRPKATIAVAPATLTFYVSKPLTGPFPVISPQTFTVWNTGPVDSSLSYVVQKLICPSPWLASFVPSTGTLVGNSSADVTVTVSPPEACLPGTYREVLRVSGYSTNAYQDVEIILVIS